MPPRDRQMQPDLKKILEQLIMEGVNMVPFEA